MTHACECKRLAMMWHISLTVPLSDCGRFVSDFGVAIGLMLFACEPRYG